jgi:hypothetical protein
MRIVMAAVAAALALVTASPTAVETTGSGTAPANGEKLQITAWAVNMSNIATGANATVDFTVTRWTTPEEREMLIVTMLENGQDALLEKLQQMPSHGRMRFPTWKGPDPMNAALGWDLRYAWQDPLPEGGRRIVLALDRYITFWEARNRPRTIDYPFTLIEMRVNKDGEGSGKMSIATKISFDKNKNVMELENFTSEPVRLQNVKVKVTT